MIPGLDMIKRFVMYNTIYKYRDLVHNKMVLHFVNDNGCFIGSEMWQI